LPLATAGYDSSRPDDEKTLRTLLREALDTDSQRNAQVIVEGFVELLTVDCFSSLAGSLSGTGSSGMLAGLFVGVTGDPGKPDKSLFEVGYGQAGQDASKVRELVEKRECQGRILPRRHRSDRHQAGPLTVTRRRDGERSR
jgi:hypothetical protein